MRMLYLQFDTEVYLSQPLLLVNSYAFLAIESLCACFLSHRTKDPVKEMVFVM